MSHINLCYPNVAKFMISTSHFAKQNAIILFRTKCRYCFKRLYSVKYIKMSPSRAERLSDSAPLEKYSQQNIFFHIPVLSLVRQSYIIYHRLQRDKKTLFSHFLYAAWCVHKKSFAISD
jgi:hypothetical protein